MSGEINNREYRQKVIKELITQLHQGKTVDEVKAKFRETFDGVSSTEISAAEQALISEGLPVEEVQRLCDVHSAVFKESIINGAQKEENIPGHPVNTLIEENKAFSRLIEALKYQTEVYGISGDPQILKSGFEQLALLDLHYKKKEILFFPYLEKYGITGPPQVMWGVDDEIRKDIKALRAKLENSAEDKSSIIVFAEETLQKAEDMIYKEENILMPMMLETLNPDEWQEIAGGMPEIGYALIPEPPVFIPAKAETEAAAAEFENSPKADSNDSVNMPTGILKIEELIKIFDTLPVDITFVDSEDRVKYFSQGRERIFPRAVSIIGRKVENCHPPASVHIVQKIVEDLRSGVKDNEDFWIKMQGKYIYIRYFAVRGDGGEYLGTLEVTQNIAPIQEISGEKRLVSE